MDEISYPVIAVSLILIFTITFIIIDIHYSEKEFESISCESLLENIQQDSKSKQHYVHEWIKKECWRNGE